MSALAEECVFVVRVFEFFLKDVDVFLAIVVDVGVCDKLECGDAAADAVFCRESQSFLERRVDDRVAACWVDIVEEGFEAHILERIHECQHFVFAEVDRLSVETCHGILCSVDFIDNESVIRVFVDFKFY